MGFFSTLTAIMLSLAFQAQDPVPRLSITEFIVSDTSTYESFRLKVINDSDSLVYIESAQPSCGCVLVTVQRNIALRDKPGDIYIAVTSAKVPPLQPITVDVYTNRNHDAPLRLYIRRADPTTNQSVVAPVQQQPVLQTADTAAAPVKVIPPKKRKRSR